MKITAFLDYRQFEAALMAMPRNIRKEVRRDLHDAAEVVASAARVNAPVDTGRLQRSIGVRSAPYTRGRVSNDLMWEVHVNCIYAGYQEFGTIHNRETKFLHNAVKSTKRTVNAMVKRSIENAINRAEWQRSLGL